MLGGQELGTVAVGVCRTWTRNGSGVVKGQCAAAMHRCECSRWMRGVAWQSIGACTPLGRAPDLQRVLYEINGTVEWQHPDLGTCQMRCASQEASEESFLLHGTRLSSVLNPHPPFLGMPSLYAMGRDEMPHRVLVPRWNGARWTHPKVPGVRMPQRVLARVWIRYRDASGALRFRRQVEVVPATTRMEMARVGASRHGSREHPSHRAPGRTGHRPRGGRVSLPAATR